MRDGGYYNQRNGALPPELSLVQASGMISSLFAGLRETGFFQEWFGYTCVDDGFVPGKAGGDLVAFVYARTWMERVEDIAWTLRTADEVALFTLVELLFDCVSQPVDGRHHDFNNCGWHYRTFDDYAGQRKWLTEVNSILKFYGDGFELTDSGEVQRVGKSGLNELMGQPLPPGAPKTERERVEHAVHVFRRGKSTLAERRSAVRDLADVLEPMREAISQKMGSKDESALFQIANKFGIRHNNKEQQTDYDPVWLDWIFYLNLSTIHLMFHLSGAAKK